MCYSCVAIILFSTDLERPAFLLIHLVFVFLCFIFSCFCFFVFLCLCCFALCFEFNVLIDLMTSYSRQVIKLNHVLFKFVFTLFRSSHRRCFIKNAVLKNFAIFSLKHLCWGLILIKLQGFSSATLSKRDSNTGVIIAKFLRIPI